MLSAGACHELYHRTPCSLVLKDLHTLVMVLPDGAAQLEPFIQREVWVTPSLFQCSFNFAVTFLNASFFNADKAD